MSATARQRLRRAGARRLKADTERSAASQALADAIQDALAVGMDKTAIAREAGVSRQTVHNLTR